MIFSPVNYFNRVYNLKFELQQIETTPEYCKFKKKNCFFEKVNFIFTVDVNFLPISPFYLSSEFREKHFVDHFEISNKC
jgi:hypothetical protein